MRAPTVAQQEALDALHRAEYPELVQTEPVPCPCGEHEEED